MTINDVILGLILTGLGFLVVFILSRITIRLTKPLGGIARSKSLARVVQWLTIVIVVFDRNANPLWGE
jgi:hypothetical protein